MSEYLCICMFYTKQLHPLNVRFVEELLAFIYIFGCFIIVVVAKKMNFLTETLIVYELKMLYYYLKEIIIMEKE